MTLDDVMEAGLDFCNAETATLDSTEEAFRAAIEAYANERVARVCAEQMEAYAEGRVKAERAACAAECKDGRYWFEIAAAIRARAQEQQT